jgi:long-chain fatty acid transport protein
MVAAIGGIALWSSSLLAQGLIIPGAGPINRSMAGASTAAPVDFGSSYWNPATISGLDRQEFLLGSELIFPSTHLNTSLPAGAINGQFPTVGRSGTSRSDSGVASNLATGGAFRLDDDSPMTFGLGVFGLIGGGVNYAGSSTPLLTPKNPPQTFGVGPIYSNMSALEITPMASWQVTDKLAVGGGPVITSASVSFSPAFFASGGRDRYGLFSFPAATNGRPFWGGGFQLGMLYELNQDWNVGFSYKSPVWQERWSWNAATPNGSPRRISLQAQIPAIYSWGVAYKGLPKTLIDVDLRYFDYANAALFGQSIRSGGLGWQGVFAVATGAQYQLSDRVTLRGGYLFNTNPIRTEGTLFNVQAPGIIEHTLSFGSSMKINDDITLTGAWVHGFRNSIAGNVSQIPGGFARFDVQTDSIVLGLNVSFGGRRRKGPAPQPMAPPVVETLAQAEPRPEDSPVTKTSATPDPRPVDAGQE